MSYTFEGQAFSSLAAFADAFPAYRDRRCKALLRQGAHTIHDMERRLAEREVARRAANAAQARRLGVLTYSAAQARRKLAR